MTSLGIHWNWNGWHSEQSRKQGMVRDQKLSPWTVCNMSEIKARISTHDRTTGKMPSSFLLTLCRHLFIQSCFSKSVIRKMAPVTDELFMTDHSDASFTVQGGASLLYSLVWWFPTWGSRSSKGSNKWGVKILLYFKKWKIILPL